MPSPGGCSSIMDERNKKDGVGSPDNPEKCLDQDYEELKKYCIMNRERFIDDMFPPDQRSIGDGILPPEAMARVVWKRPGRLTDNPQFILDGISRFDFAQGQLGNCWFLASIGTLTFQRHIRDQVIPKNQSFTDGYAGIFHFRFWRFGKWVDVVIDDKLPTLDGRLIFVQSKSQNEFWSALLEKAYAKVCGSYADMNGGTVAEALVDFTGGVHMCFDLKDAPADLWDLMFRACQSKSLMGCGTPQGATAANTVLPNGIVEGHAYTITGVHKVTSNGQPVKLVRLFNPWGQGEWNGAWSDKSAAWQTVSSEERPSNATFGENGEFWMSMEDFCNSYNDMDICCLCPDFLDGSSECHWTSKFREARWVAGRNAGGCMNYPDSFYTNPQYRITIDAVDDECSAEQGPNNMLVSLMQKPDKRNRRLVKSLYIGFSIFSVCLSLFPIHSQSCLLCLWHIHHGDSFQCWCQSSFFKYKGTRGKLPAEFFQRPPVASSKNYLNAREVMAFFRLEPGDYVVVPSTFKPNETASFILAILSKSENHFEDGSHDHDHGKPTKEEKGSEHGEHGEHGDEDDSKPTLLRQYSNQFEEVGAELLQNILNERLLPGKSPGFGIDTCRSMVFCVDKTCKGYLDRQEFERMWSKISKYASVFNQAVMEKDGVLPVTELSYTLTAVGIQVSDSMLNQLAFRYGSQGNLNLESFLTLVLRLKCMFTLFDRWSNGIAISLQENEENMKPLNNYSSHG
ncbi:calpain-1 catalytic subunit-like [Engraulis encrasicolus]|uniref:calpain-1 catalytic subunit-like n=1 Tax=Engraulis encrasicolus TaxID=184585 RepID=UPI002FD21408